MPGQFVTINWVSLLLLFSNFRSIVNFDRFIISVFVVCGSLQGHASEPLKINEFMASNISVQFNPDTSDFVDWIELYNSGDSPITLSGLFLSDDFTNPHKWMLPDDAVIEPAGFYVVWADGITCDNHASYKLSESGEQIGLYYPDGRIIDTIRFGIQRDDVSFGRFPDGGDNWHYFTSPTCGFPNSSPGLGSSAQLSKPVCTPEGGLYSGEQTIILSSEAGTNIYFTLDGSSPTPESQLYTDPIQLQGTTVIRARAFKNNKLPSNILTHSFIINEPSTLPVISISTPPEFLFDEEIGITPGICKSDELGSPPPFDMSANFWKRWERPVHIEFYTPEGEQGFKQDAGIAIFGGFLGRQLRQKAFTLYARNKYGDPDFDYPLFQSKSSNSCSRFLLRCSSNDYNRTFIRDAMMNSLVIGQMDVDYQASQSAMVYINGEFWGLYNIREKMNQFYPESNYGINPDRVELIEGFDMPAHGDDLHYRHFMEYVVDHDLAFPENYQYVKTQMDVVEFMNYYITEIYVCNHDWLHQNIKCWREQGMNGKWRWLLYDMDWGFNGQDPFGSDQAPDNTIQWVLDQGHVSILFQRLIMNENFRTEFAQRFVTHNNLTFAPERVHAIIDSMAQIIAPEMPRQIERWGAIPNMEYWSEQLDQLHQFAQDRQVHILTHLAETLVPEEKGELILEVSNEKAGWISVFEVPCPVPYFSNFWYRNIPLKIQAHAKPGWRFVRWEGHNSSSDRNIQLRLSDNAALNAVFEPAELPSIIISEIHYNPSTDLQGDDEEFEFVELLNNDEYRIDISGYQFTEGIEYTFPNGCNIDAGEYIIVAKNAQAYSGITARVFQLSDGRLNDAGEELTLSNYQGTVIDHVHFDDRSPWPEEPDGEGPSLELKDPSLDNNLASSWRRSDGIGGNPGTGSMTGIDELKQITDEQFKFSIHPNPFGYATSIRYSLTEESRTTVRILNSSGQEVGILESAILNPGIYEQPWEPRSLPPGVYFVHISSGKYNLTKKAIYLQRD